MKPAEARRTASALATRLRALEQRAAAIERDPREMSTPELEARLRRLYGYMPSRDELERIAMGEEPEP